MQSLIINPMWGIIKSKLSEEGISEKSKWFTKIDMDF